MGFAITIRVINKNIDAIHVHVISSKKTLSSKESIQERS